MKRETKVTLLVAAIVTVLVGAPLLAQEQAPEMDDAMQKMMAAWAGYGEMGKEHELMARSVGEWKVTVKFWAAPGAPPSISEGSSTVKPIMGGRYLLESFTSSTPQGPFEGMGLNGFDNITGKYVGIWIDSMSTGIMRAEGSANEDGSVLTFTGESPDPMAGTYKQQRSVVTVVDDDHHLFEVFDATPDGTEFKSMEIAYERQ
jgi:hypothetical protein